MNLFWNFFKAWAVTTWARWHGYQILAPPAAVKRRDEICKGCDYYNDGICGACGCLLVAKSILSTEKCPKGKWGRIWIQKSLTK